MPCPVCNEGAPPRPLADMKIIAMAPLSRTDPARDAIAALRDYIAGHCELGGDELRGLALRATRPIADLRLAAKLHNTLYDALLVILVRRAVGDEAMGHEAADANEALAAVTAALSDR